MGQQRFEIEVVGRVLPFKVSNYLVAQPIDWDKVPNWVQRPFCTEYNAAATWIDELKPVFGE